MRKRNMKLWELRPAPGLDTGNGPWKPWGDQVIGLIVRAETEAKARKFAREEAGGEDAYIWLDGKYSTCAELLPDGEPGIVITDFHAA